MSDFLNSLFGELENKDSDFFILDKKDPFVDAKYWLHTGSSVLDYDLNTFGYPGSCFVEIAGPSKSGKTTLGMTAIKEFKKLNKDGVVVILSSERRDNRDYAKKIGIDPTEIGVKHVKYVEDMFFTIAEIVQRANDLWSKMEKPGKPSFCFLWDSIGATLSKAELDTIEENLERRMKNKDKGKDVGEDKHEKMMAFAKEAKKFAKNMVALAYDNDINFIMLNHTYDTTYGSKSTGGQWIEYLTTMRFLTKVIETIKVPHPEKKDEKIKVAQITKVEVIKSDFNTRGETKIRILFGYGLVLTEEEIDFAVDEGIIKKEGALKHSFMDGKLTWTSENSFFQNYKNKEKLPYIKILHEKVKKAYHEKVKANRGLIPKNTTTNDIID